MVEGWGHREGRADSTEAPNQKVVSENVPSNSTPETSWIASSTSGFDVSQSTIGMLWIVSRYVAWTPAQKATAARTAAFIGNQKRKKGKSDE